MSMFNDSRSRGHHGFSLVEMLVVIGILGVLVGILLPVLSRARDASRSAVCQTNLRQLHVLTAVYVQSHRGRLFVGPEVDPDGLWTGSLGIPASVDESSVGILRCPSVQGFADVDAPAAGPHRLVGEGGPTLGWTQPFSSSGQRRRGSYGWNAATSALQLSKVRSSTETPLYADSARPAGIVEEDTGTSIAPPDEDQLTPEQEAYARAGGFRIERHGRRVAAWINVVFLDSHVESVDLWRLARLAWMPRGR